MDTYPQPLESQLKESNVLRHRHVRCERYDDCLEEVCLRWPHAQSWTCQQCDMFSPEVNDDIE